MATKKTTHRPVSARKTAALDTHHTGKFYVGDANVKVRYPTRTSWSRVQGILDKHAPSRFSLKSVSDALAKVGASFVPWEDKKPGYHGVYR